MDKDKDSKHQFAWQSGWDQMINELVAEEAVQREVAEKDQFKPPLQVGALLIHFVNNSYVLSVFDKGWDGTTSFRCLAGWIQA